MHETTKRLFEAATEARPQDIIDWASLARYIDVTEQSTTNWKARGVPKKQIIRLADLFGVSAAWLETGKEPKRIGDKKLPYVTHISALEPVIADFVLLLDEDQHRIIAEIKSLADIAKKYRARFGSSSANSETVAKHIPPAPKHKHGVKER